MATSASLYRVQLRTDGGQCVEFCGTFNELRKVITDPVLVQQLEGQVNGHEDHEQDHASNEEVQEESAEIDPRQFLEEQESDTQADVDDTAEMLHGVFAAAGSGSDHAGSSGVAGLNGSAAGNSSLIAILPDDAAGPGAGDATGFQWPKKAVLQLIKLFDVSIPLFESPAYTQRQVWKMIAKKLNATEGFVVTPLQVDTKWRGLKKTYKKVTDHNAVAGVTPRKWEFYSAMDAILQKQNEMAAERAPQVTFDVQQPASSSLSSTADLPSPTLGSALAAAASSSSRLTSSSGDDSAERRSSAAFSKRRRITCTSLEVSGNCVAAIAGQTASTGERQPMTERATTTTTSRCHQTEPPGIPDWIALLREDLEERRKIRQEERNKILMLLDKIADKL